MLVGFGVESLLTACERAFEACGVELGQITSTSLALASAVATRRSSSGLTALAHLQPEGYTLLLARRDEPVVVRLKPFAAGLPEEERAALVGQELRLTRSYIAERLPGEELETVVLAAPPEIATDWLRVLSEGLGHPAVALSAAQLPLAAEGASAPWIELAPLLGAACREVA